MLEFADGGKAADYVSVLAYLFPAVRPERANSRSESVTVLSIQRCPSCPREPGADLLLN